MYKNYYIVGPRGEIQETFLTTPATAQRQLLAGDLLVEGHATYDEHYVVDGELLERPSLGLQIEGFEISNLKPPCIVLINGTSYDCEDTELSLSFTEKETFTVRIIPPWPYKEEEFTLENTSS